MLLLSPFYSSRNTSIILELNKPSKSSSSFLSF
jgi:hypothetical protein